MTRENFFLSPQPCLNNLFLTLSDPAAPQSKAFTKMSPSEVSPAHNNDTFIGQKSQSVPVIIHPSDTFPQQFLKCDQPFFPVESFDDYDDYSFAPVSVPPILRTTSFECDDSSAEVFYTPVTEKSIIELKDNKSKSLSASLPKELNLPDELPISKSAPTSPASTSKHTRSKLKLNLSFKLKGLRSSKGLYMFSRDGRKSSANSESSISIESPGSVQSGPTSCMGQYHSPSCNNSVTGTEVTEFHSNLSSRLVHGVLNIDDSFESDGGLNPICATAFTSSNDNTQAMQSGGLVVVEECDEEVELVYDGLSIADEDKMPVEFDTHNFEEECDVYFAGGTLDTVHGACGELVQISPTGSNVSTLTKASLQLASPTPTIDTSGSTSSFSSVSTSSRSSTTGSCGILKPPRRATQGYDPFGVNTDFETGMPKRTVHFFENINEVETASEYNNLMLSGDSDSDDSTLSLEYAMRYCGLKTGLYDSSSSTESAGSGDFVPVRS